MPSLRHIGPFPPPFGGVAMHCIRLAEQQRAAGWDVLCLSVLGVPHHFPSVRRLGVRDFFSRVPVHYHTDQGNWKWTILLGLWMRLLFIPYKITVHSFREHPALSGRVVKGLIAWVYSGADELIAISTETQQAVGEKLNIPLDRIAVKSSALLISHWEKEFPLPEGIPLRWLEAKTKMLVNAGRVSTYEGLDLYGIDIVIAAFKKLQNPAVELLIVCGDVIDTELFASYAPYAVVLQDTPLVPVVAVSDIVIRATRTEGGPSLSLTEAVELGKIAIGSDCVRRPVGTILFKSGNAEDLMLALRSVVRV